jgi:DNA-binding winged helix-turn-helix (wHTH) protein
VSPLSSVPGILRFGDFEVDLHSGELRKHGIRIKLQVQPFQILLALLEHPGEVVDREQLQKRIWAPDTFVDFDHGLNNAVKKLREALADDAEKPRFIETLSKRGYRFIGQVEGRNGPPALGESAVIPPVRPIPILSRRTKPRRIVLWTSVIFVLATLIVGWRLAGSRTGTFRHATAKARGASKGSPIIDAWYPVPLINRPLVPTTAGVGGPAFTLTVNGSGFVPGSLVNWNGQERATTFLNNSQLKASILALDIAKSGTVSVTVVNPGKGSGESNEVFFSVGGSGYILNLIRHDFFVGSRPDSVAVGDFNGDGKLDLAVANAGDGSVSILLGKGNGTFQSPMSYAAGQGPFSQVAVGDFNGDGKLDVVVSNFGSNNVSVLLGNGDGTFRAATQYSVGRHPSSVAVADVNGDGKLDLIVSNQNCTGGSTPCGVGTVSILLGNGDGTFREHVDYATGGNDPNWVAVGDFNADGKLDLAVANGGVGPSSVSILLGNGDGSFQKAVLNSLGVNGVSVAAADFNGDGNLDLAVIDNMGWISIFLGNGDGTFQTRTDYYTSGSFPCGYIGIGDFSGNGTLDIAVANSGSNSVTILFGYGNGTFEPSGARFDTGLTPSGVAVGDFNGNGRLDLAVASRYGNAVSILSQ